MFFFFNCGGGWGSSWKKALTPLPFLHRYCSFVYSQGSGTVLESRGMVLFYTISKKLPILQGLVVREIINLQICFYTHTHITKFLEQYSASFSFSGTKV